MIITFPKSVKIGGKQYKVLCPYKFTERDDIFGQINHQTLEIKIATKTSNEEQRAPEELITTLLHEILHGIDGVYGCRCGQEGASTEHIISQLSEGLFQVLTDLGWYPFQEKDEDKT